MQKFFGYANRLLQQLSGWLVSDDLGGEDAGYRGPGLVWLHVVLPNSLKRLWRRLMVEKLTFISRATALVDIPAVSMPIARHPLSMFGMLWIGVYDSVFLVLPISSNFFFFFLLTGFRTPPIQ